jgi:monovalent cation:H+ antiporter-2, CPA2 family
MEIPLLTDMVIMLSLSVVVILVFQRIRIPSILGFLVVGALVGPYGLSLVKAVHEVEVLAEIGVIFLLFVIGIEFSLRGLVAIRRTVLGGGAMQVGGTILLTAGLTYGLGLPLAEAFFMGFLIALSSTAIVLKLLQQNGQITAPHGRVAVGILIFQDVIVVPMMLLTPLLSGQAEAPGLALLLMLGKFAGVLLMVALLARYVVPYLLNQVVRTRSNELFLLTIIVMCFATAWLTSAVGLSLALGAFFAGLVISESPYHHQATALILPFREIFVSFFFVSIGMLLDIQFVLSHLVEVLVLTVGVILLKALVLGITVVLLRYPYRTALLAILTLFQVGEFAFILAARGSEYDLIGGDIYQYFLAISVLTMALTPFLIAQSERLSRKLEGVLPRNLQQRMQQQAQAQAAKESPEQPLQDHLLIIGYGINGRNLSRAARQADIPYLIVELNPKTVREAKAEGEPIIYGDATQETLLRDCQAHRARVVVIAISDPVATRRILAQVREMTGSAYVIVRTRYVAEINEARQLGANDVIPEEFETSIEIFTRVLGRYLVPRNEINQFVQQIRAQNYETFREPHAQVLTPVLLHEVEIATVRVRQGENTVVGRSLDESQLRQRYGVNLLAIRRGDSHIIDIRADERILTDDILYLFGPPARIVALSEDLD